MSDLQSRTSARPRVLLADDHPTFLKWVSRFLDGSCDIVGLAANGREALDLNRRLRPEVVVLDVTMPELDGFQTLEHLRRESPETRVVFLTMHADDEFVAAAIEGGALGYVVKSRIAPDLITAIEYARAGRLFVPSLTSLAKVPGVQHALQVHADDRHHLDTVSDLVATTVRSGDPVVIVTTEATRAGISRRLQARRLAVGALIERGQYIEHDSPAILSQLVHDGRLDRDCLREFADAFDRFRLGAPSGSGGRLTVVSDVAISLCRNGDFDAALDLKGIWNELTRALPFFTLCSYPTECFETPAARDQLSRICAEHSAVIA
jgi:DNA-binding NarL/FixJ family response regulator